jgi:hypothetical protein
MRDGQILPQGKLFRDIGYRERPVEVTGHGKVERPAAVIKNAVATAIVWAGIHDVLKGRIWLSGRQIRHLDMQDRARLLACPRELPDAVYSESGRGFAAAPAIL